MSLEIEQLRAEYLNQVNKVLPALSLSTGNYPVVYNHCWARILFDNLFGQCWYNSLDTTKEPAYKQLDKDQLIKILTWIEVIKERPDIAKLMNNNSLKWRIDYE